MRSLIAVMLAIVSINAHSSAQVKCYSNGKLIYSGAGEEIEFLDPLFTFKEKDSNRIMFINADCVIKF